MSQHGYIAHIQLDMITSIFNMQTRIRSLHMKGSYVRHSYVQIPTHPPLYNHEEDIEGFGLSKEEVQAL